ncbi:hypothetical protein LCGC14_2776220 [marine sediment metagenome]|uniref:Uncharacterized protein n=1 Tax=marine sediment metagenome TaxID=412755 RepID=A0A0F8ZGK8_9ZZZZ
MGESVLAALGFASSLGWLIVGFGMGVAFVPFMEWISERVGR